MKRMFRILTLIALIGLMRGNVVAQTPGDKNRGFNQPPIDREVGLILNTEYAKPGYTLITPIQSKDVILVSNDGRVVNVWSGEHYLANSAYLLENGHLLRTVSLDDTYSFFPGGRFGFIGGRIEERDWNNELVWSFDYISEDYVTHHDLELMPNGHILMIAFERLEADEAIAQGFNAEHLTDTNELWLEKIIEVDPVTNEIVWEWRLADHLIQDFDENQNNYGVVAENPGRIDINYLDPDEPEHPNWFHVNSVDYNADLDQIVISPRHFSEIWILDHNTTTEEARGPAGDLIYRWGNPSTYDTETEDGRTLYYQHDPKWIPEGYPGAGNILIYNNGGAPRLYSSVIEINIPRNNDGSYNPPKEQAPEIVWEYFAPEDTIFYSSLVSGAERFENGNTLITEGLSGNIFEVDTDGNLVWAYNLPQAMGAFRAERYDYPFLYEMDEGQDLDFSSGVIWGVDCQDGERPRLYEDNIWDFFNHMQGYMEEHGEQAQAIWEIEACAEHGGLTNMTEDGRVWGALCEDGTLPRLHRDYRDDIETMALFIDTHGEEDAQSTWESEACMEHGGLAPTQ